MSFIRCMLLSDGCEVPIPARTVLCLGNFDGVHLGHAALFKRAISLRDKDHPEASTAVFCFSTLSSDHLSSERVGHLTTQQEKLACFAAYGMEYVLLCDFSAVRHLSPIEFISDVLEAQCAAVGVVCGFNYRFGFGGSGTVRDLQSRFLGSVSVCEPILFDGEPISSTRIRRLLTDGEAEAATRLMGRPYALRAEVLHGKALGRQWGIPTVNQAFPKEALIPRHGVYVTDCIVDGGRTYRAVTNVGLRPTVEDANAANCESFLLDFEGDLYGKTVETRFLSFLRPETRFSSSEDLIEQIRRDIQAAKNY